MTSTDEYTYRNNARPCTHAYLFPAVRKFLSAAPPRSRVLDLGCGNGAMLAEFRQNRFELHGTDFSRTGIALARKAYPEIAFAVADASGDLSSVHQDSYFDFIFSTEVIEHLYNPRGLLRSCFQLLKPHGRLLISTPYHGYLKNLVLAATGALDGHFTVLWDHGHIKFWSRATLGTALKEAGFRDLRFHGAGRIPYLWKSMVMTCTKPDPSCAA